MRSFFYVFLIVGSLISCSKDDLPGCIGNGQEGEICKEYQYTFGEYNGLNDYQYDESGDYLVNKITKSSSGKTEGSVHYFYAPNGVVSKIELKNANAETLQEKVFVYNDEGDVLEEKTTGNVNVSKSFKYENSVLRSIDNFEEGVIVSTDSVEYFTGTTDLYRTLNFQDGEVTRITYNEWFGEVLRKESVYNGNGIKQESKVERYENGKIIEELFYTAAGNISQEIAYKYEGGRLKEVNKTDESGKVFEQLIYQRF